MATILPTFKNLDNHQDKATIIQWPSLQVTDEGEVLTMQGSADRSVQVEGVFGGATLVIEGSNDGTNYRTLKDHLGNQLSFTSPNILSIDQITQFVRPRVVNGDVSTALTVTMLVRRLAP